MMLRTSDGQKIAVLPKEDGRILVGSKNKKEREKCSVSLTADKARELATALVTVADELEGKI